MLRNSLRTMLEEEWASPGVKFSNHFCQWAENNVVGRQLYGHESPLTGLWYRKGTKCKSVSIRPRTTARKRALKL
jgi:hypothetical protein